MLVSRFSLFAYSIPRRVKRLDRPYSLFTQCRIPEENVNTLPGNR